MGCDGVVVNVSGPAVVASGMADCRMHDRVHVGESGLMGEIMQVLKLIWQTVIGLS